jgi:hypothetical protein
MAKRERRHSLDPARVVAAIAAAERVHREAVDEEAIGRIVNASISALNAQHDAFHAVSAGQGGGGGGGGATCRSWLTISCAPVGPSPKVEVHNVAPAARGDGPIAWGGSSCWTFGGCTYCMNYECRRDPA